MKPSSLLAAAGALVIGIFVACAHPTALQLVGGKAADAYYNLLIEGFRAGHLSLQREVPPELAQLASPYDPMANAAIRTPGSGLHDVSYYQGKLYLYFGITPALVLFWPWAVLTGHYLFHQWAVVIFCSIAFGAGAGLLWALGRRYFAEVGVGVVAAGTLALGLAASAPILLQRADVWEVAIACGQAMMMLALAAVGRALVVPAHAGRWLALASLALGLAVGARPSLLVGAVILVVPLVAAGKRSVAAPGPPAHLLRRLVAASAPLAFCGLGLALYNYARFHNVLEFGQSYQLAGDRQDLARHFSPRYLGFNFRVYFLQPSHWVAHFPFVRENVPPPPPGHGTVEDPFGILLNIPVVLLAFAAPLAWRGRSDPDRAALRGIVAAIAWVFASSALVLNLFYGDCSRYEFEFLPALLLLAVVGIFGLERALADRPAWRLGARGGWGLLLIFSVAFNLLMASAHFAEERCDLGNILFRRGQIPAAIGQYEAALRVEPTFGKVRNNLGTALLRLGQPAAARQQFELAVQLEPGNAMAHYGLGIALASLGREAEADAQYREAIRLRPDLAPRPASAP